VAELVVEYAAAATRMHEYGVTNPLAGVPSVLLRTVVANSALGKLYCNTFPALAFPPKLIGKPPGVAQVGTVLVVLSICPATVLIARKVVFPADDWYGIDPPRPPAILVHVLTVAVCVPETVRLVAVSVANPGLY
jgi:hypothetical protein